MSPNLSSCWVALFLIFSLPSLAQNTLVVAAAADLSPLESTLASAFATTHPSTNIRFVTESSATLAQQIENGAPYDVFLSANALFVDRLAAEGKLSIGSVQPYAVGRLGLLWREPGKHEMSELAGSRVRIVALPNPKLAPYGVAARQALEHLSIWTKIQSKVVYGENVRQTLEIFESGNADAVITSDSLLTGKHPVLIPSDWHKPILQKAGMVAATSNHSAAEAFVDFLVSPAGQAVFSQYGFGPPPKP